MSTDEKKKSYDFILWSDISIFGGQGEDTPGGFRKFTDPASFLRCLSTLVEKLDNNRNCLETAVMFKPIVIFIDHFLAHGALSLCQNFNGPGS